LPIIWEYPAPRAGWRGWLDRFIGPGTTKGELIVQLAPAVLGMIFQIVYALYAGLGWTAVQLLVAALLAFDLFGGAVTLAASPAKRWQHRDYRPKWRGPLNRLVFAFLHLHPFIVAWLFMGRDWLFGWVVWGLMCAACVVVEFAPLHMKRPLAAVGVIIGLVAGLTVLKSPPGLEWFVPVYFLKLVIGHTTLEAPFRPEPPVNAPEAAGQSAASQEAAHG
jgi:hypothetical protein